MTLLSKIINPDNKSMMNKSYKNNYTHLNEYLDEPDSIDLDYQSLNPTNQSFIMHIPTKSYNFSFYDTCNYVHSWIFKLENIFNDTCDYISNMFSYWKSLKSNKTIQKEFERKKKQFIQSQVKTETMRKLLFHFNVNNTFWEERTTEAGEMYRVRNMHTFIRDRNIQRHWNSTFKQSVIA